jgi:hypothetical protein
VTDLLEVSDEKLSQLEPSPLKNLLKQFENNTVNSIWSGLEKKSKYKIIAIIVKRIFLKFKLISKVKSLL